MKGRTRNLKTSSSRSMLCVTSLVLRKDEPLPSQSSTEPQMIDSSSFGSACVPTVGMPSLQLYGLTVAARHDADPLWGAVSDIVSWKRKAANHLPLDYAVDVMGKRDVTQHLDSLRILT